MGKGRHLTGRVLQDTFMKNPLKGFGTHPGRTPDHGRKRSQELTDNDIKELMVQRIEMGERRKKI